MKDASVTDMPVKDTPSKSLPRYWAPWGGLPGQHELLSGRAVFTEAYAFIPRGVMTDIVTSALPFWEGSRAWIIATTVSASAPLLPSWIDRISSSKNSALPPDCSIARAIRS